MVPPPVGTAPCLAARSTGSSRRASTRTFPLYWRANHWLAGRPVVCLLAVTLTRTWMPSIASAYRGHARPRVARWCSQSRWTDFVEAITDW